uniref:Uncharacterized protein n=1 Tax=Setaria italica TaxID=4555 RepID=K3YKQ9_SETIT
MCNHNIFFYNRLYIWFSLTVTQVIRIGVILYNSSFATDTAKSTSTQVCRPFKRLTD